MLWSDPAVVSEAAQIVASNPTSSMKPSAAVPVGKSNPDILVVQPAENWAAKDLPSVIVGNSIRLGSGDELGDALG